MGEAKKRGRKAGSVGMVSVIRIKTVNGKTTETVIDTFPQKELAGRIVNLKEGRYAFKTFASGGKN